MARRLRNPIFSAESEYRYYGCVDKRTWTGEIDPPIVQVRAGGYINEKKHFELIWGAEARSHVDGMKVLDVGSGESFLGCAMAEMFEPQMVYCIDAILPQVWKTYQAWKHFRFSNALRFCLGDAYNLPVRTGSVDLVFISRVVHHLPHYYRVLAEIDRVLRPGGELVIFEPNDSSWVLALIGRFREPGSENEGRIETEDITRYFANVGYECNVSYFWVRFPRVRFKHLATNYLLVARKRDTPYDEYLPDPPLGTGLEKVLCCPVTRRGLQFSETKVRVEDEQEYPILGGLPVLVRPGELRDLALKWYHAHASL